MELRMARFLNDREGMLDYLARANIVPVLTDPGAKQCSFELRRDQGKEPAVSPAMAARIINALGVIDENSCKGVGERIKDVRQSRGYQATFWGT